MFTYRCLECGKKHVHPTPFVADFQVACHRCGRPVSLTRETVQPLMGTAAPARATPARVGDDSITTRPARGGSVEENGITTAATKGPKGKGDADLSRAAPDYREIGDEAADAVELPTPRGEEEDEATEEGEAPPKGKKGKKGKDSSQPKKKPAAKPWLLPVAIAVPLVLASGGGLYWFLGKPKQVALPKPPPPPPPAAPAPPIKVAPKPVAPVMAEPIAFLSAPRLAAELSADPAATDRKYHDALIQVSGLIDRVELPKVVPPPPPPPGGAPAPARPPAPTQPPLVHFQADKGAVACSPALGSPDEDRWKSLRNGTPMTVRGKYSKGGLLLGCEVRAPSAPADARYKGKAVEVEGPVDSVLLPGAGTEYPTVRLERETDGKVEVQFLFMKSDAEAVKRLAPGVRVTIRGTCGGRTEKAGRYQLRFDNCRLIQTTAPESGVPRLSAVDFGREYEEDLRGDFLPLQGSEDRVEQPISVTQLSKDRKADGKSLLKYRNKIVTVSGRIAGKDDSRVTLESPETDQPLKVVCDFGKGAVPDFADLPEVRVRGLCRVAEGGQTLRLDNCSADPSQLRPKVPLLTADYLPHVAGTTLVYDFALFPPAVKGGAVVSRYVWFQRDGGVTETVLTHTGRMTAPSLFGPNAPDDWSSGPKVKKGRLPGSVYVQKEDKGMIVHGPRVIGPAAGANEALEPALKLGAKAGDSWTFVRKNAKHAFTLERFDTWRGRPSAVVTEVVVTPLPGDPQREVRHVYVRGVGEVERQEWILLTSSEKKLIAEKKIILLEDLPFRGPKQEKEGVKVPAKGGAKRDTRINPSPRAAAGSGPAAPS